MCIEVTGTQDQLGSSWSQCCETVEPCPCQFDVRKLSYSRPRAAVERSLYTVKSVALNFTHRLLPLGCHHRAADTVQ